MLVSLIPKSPEHPRTELPWVTKMEFVLIKETSDEKKKNINEGIFIIQFKILLINIIRILWQASWENY